MKLFDFKIEKETENWKKTFGPFFCSGNDQFFLHSREQMNFPADGLFIISKTWIKILRRLNFACKESSKWNTKASLILF